MNRAQEGRADVTSLRDFMANWVLVVLTMIAGGIGIFGPQTFGVVAFGCACIFAGLIFFLSVCSFLRRKAAQAASSVESPSALDENRRRLMPQYLAFGVTLFVCGVGLLLAGNAVGGTFSVAGTFAGVTLIAVAVAFAAAAIHLSKNVHK
jgi:hypothetical protein